MNAEPGHMVGGGGNRGEARTQARGLSWRVARIAGIDIRIHATFLLIVLILWLQAADPKGPGLPAGFRWLGIVFGSVLLHELAHSILARRRGADVRAIVLLPIGGMSQIENMPERPTDRLAIAIVGPLTSFAIAGVGAMAAFATGSALLPVDLYGGLNAVVWINLLLGGFNMLPAFPLDGGRVFQAILEQRMDPVRATHAAATVGRWLALAMIATGFMVSLWLAVIGAFVYFAASAEESASAVHAQLKDVHASSVMLVHPVTLAPDLAVDEVRAGLPAEPQRDFPVTRDGVYVGLVSAEAMLEAPVGARMWQVMDAGAPTLAPDDPVETVVLPALMRSQRTALAVLEGRSVIGLVTLEGLRRALAHRNRPVAGDPLRRDMRRSA